MTDGPRRLLQRLVLRTGRSPLRLLWSFAYRALERSIAFLLRLHYPERTVYVAGGFASREPVYGVSDLDLIVVTPTRADASGREREAVAARWTALRKRLRIRDGPLHVVAIEQAGLAAAAAGTAFTHGLGRRQERPDALYHGSETIWRTGGAGLLHGPGMAGPGGAWRRIAGPERRPSGEPIDPQTRPLIAWLSVQSWWRLAFDACLNPDRPHVPYLCVKLISEPLRALLWLRRGGEPLRGRVAPLRLALHSFPRFEEPARRALELHQILPRSPSPPLEQTLADFALLSSEVGGAVGEIAFEGGAEEVSLLGAGRDELVLPGPLEAPRLPLADWRALCYWFPPDEALLPVEGNPGRPTDLARAARLDDGHRCPALRQGDLIVEPTDKGHPRGRLRSAQCRASDPVSFALLSGEETAAFPAIPGWSIEDWAQRATAEHGAWLARSDEPPADDPGFILAKLFGATRAALLLESVRAGAPELPLTAVASANALVAAFPGAGAAVEEAIAHLRAWRRDQAPVPGSVTGALRAHVRSLPAYRSAAPSFKPRARERQADPA